MPARKPILFASYAAVLGVAAAGIYGAVRTTVLTRRYLAERRGTPAYAETSMPTPSSTSAETPARPAAPRPIESADAKPTPGFFGAIKEIVYEFLSDDVMTQAAALAFYTGLALAPILTIAAWAARVFMGSAKKYDVALAFSKVMGKQAYAPIEELLKPATQQANTGWNVAGLISIALVAFSASGVFGQVQSALNAIWHVQAKPSNGLIGFIQKRVVSLGMLATILFLLFASVVVSTALQGRLTAEGQSETTIVAVILNNLFTVGLFSVLFALMFKFVPDAKIGWKPVWVGGVLSAVLFAVGKAGLSIYLGRGSYETSYGAAVGSFVALLVWVYYSGVILLVGAEATEVYARRQGEALEPDKHAVRVVQTTEPA